MKNIWRGLLLGCLLIFLDRAQAQEQPKQPQRVNQLREAREDSAQDALKSDLFTASFLKAVLLWKQNAPEAEVRAAFAQAIKIDPNRRLEGDDRSPNLTVIFSRHPLLAYIFRDVRDRLVGCIFVTSEPSNVEVLGVQGDSVVFRKTTPGLLCNLLTNQIQIVFTKHGFEDQLLTIQPKPGRVDTLSVTLKPEMMVVQSKPDRPGDSLKVTLEPTTLRKPDGGKWQTWLWRGIAVAGAATIAAVVIRENDGGKGGDEIQNLPEPPPRPVPRFK
jgi:hypothetical protein